MMEKITLKEMQKLEFDMLQVFQQLCNDNKLQFFLAGGTLLGAIRHKGFIPWDDDIDILMPRKDYERLKELASAGEIAKYCTDYEIKIPGEKNYSFPFIKVTDNRTAVYETMYSRKYAIGAWIDIFPLDRYYNSDKRIRFYLKKVSILLHLRYGAVVSLRQYIKEIRNKPSWKIKLFYCFKLCFIFILKAFLSIIRCERICLYVDRIAKRMNAYETEPIYVGNGSWPSKFKDHFSIESFASSIERPFETALMPVPKGHHEYLERMYGNYMTPPDLPDRKGHSLTAYWVK